MLSSWLLLMTRCRASQHLESLLIFWYRELSVREDIIARRESQGRASVVNRREPLPARNSFRHFTSSAQCLAESTSATWLYSQPWMAIFAGVGHVGQEAVARS